MYVTEMNNMEENMDSATQVVQPKCWLVVALSDQHAVTADLAR